jgi:hypothetical protein
MIPTLSASWPSHSIARAIFCRFNSETVITCAERSPRTLSVTLMTAKVIRRASPTPPSSPFFGNPIDWSSARHQATTSSRSRLRPCAKAPRCPADWNVLKKYSLPKPSDGLLAVFNDTVPPITAQCLLADISARDSRNGEVSMRSLGGDEPRTRR